MIAAMAKLTLESVVARSGKLLTAPVDGDLVMLDTESSRYFGLDPIGHRIWELLEEPSSVEALCSAMEAEFEVSPETCEEDVLGFLGELEEANLVEVR
jgi:Coenzyme PQQ synthesis protein D (PqqD)